MSSFRKKDIYAKSIAKSKMADISDDEGASVRPKLIPKHRRGDRGFTGLEILQRAELFKDEYNREDIHDRVLVLQVMPDDYEMREMTARLELHEIGAAMTEVRSNAEAESPPSEISASGFCFDISIPTHEEGNTEEKSVNVVDYDSAVEGDQFLRSTRRKATVTPEPVVVAGGEICEPDGIASHTGEMPCQMHIPIRMRVAAMQHK